MLQKSKTEVTYMSIQTFYTRNIIFGSLFIPSQNCEKRQLNSSCLSICLSVCMEKLCSHWTDFHEIWYLNMFRKSVKEIHL
jgi:hypothetical protein